MVFFRSEYSLLVSTCLSFITLIIQIPLSLPILLPKRESKMVRNAMNDDDENRLLSSNNEEEDDQEEEEALSLSDLPIHVEKLQPDSKESESGLPMIQLPDDDFDFGSSTTEPEMCAADDVFFRGRILPLRHSISSDSGLTLLRADSRTLSRSGSMDQYKMSHKNTIIRSSSIRSQYSSSCSSSRSSSTRTNNTIPKPPKPKPPNPFQHYSNRKPVPGNLNRASSSRSYMGQGQMIKSNNNNNNNMWSILRLGLVRTPTMEPIDMKFHGGKNNNRNLFIQIQGKEKENENEKKKNEVKKFPYFGGCKCSVETVVVPSSCKGITKEKTKRDMSRRHRTYEWLKDLSVADDDDDEGERGNLGKVDSC